MKKVITTREHVNKKFYIHGLKALEHNHKFVKVHSNQPDNPSRIGVILLDGKKLSIKLENLKEVSSNDDPNILSILILKNINQQEPLNKLKLNDFKRLMKEIPVEEIKKINSLTNPKLTIRALITLQELNKTLLSVFSGNKEINTKETFNELDTNFKILDSSFNNEDTLTLKKWTFYKYLDSLLYMSMMKIENTDLPPLLQIAIQEVKQGIESKLFNKEIKDNMKLFLSKILKNFVLILEKRCTTKGKKESVESNKIFQEAFMSYLSFCKENIPDCGSSVLIALDLILQNTSMNTKEILTNIKLFEINHEINYKGTTHPNHILLQISDGKKTIYCDPWAGISFETEIAIKQAFHCKSENIEICNIDSNIFYKELLETYCRAHKD